MNQNKLLKKLGFLLVMLIFGAGSVFAQTYVSNTNGNDVTGDGTILKPYRTIAVGITNTASAGTIIVDPDTYNEVNVAIGDAYTFIAQDFWAVPSGLTVVTITNGITIAPGAAKTVSLGETGLTFNLGATATALVLTDGTLNIVTANVTIASGGTVTRTAGTLNAALTTTNVNVTFDGAVDILAGLEVPADLGTGLLTVNITAGKTATFANGIETTGGITVTTGSATFNGDLDLSTSTFRNTPALNAVSITGDMSFTSGVLVNTTTGVVVIDGDMTWSLGANLGTGISNVGNGDITVNGTLNFANDGVTAVSNYTALINNAGTGTLTLDQGFTTTHPTATEQVSISIGNASTGDFVANGPVTVFDIDQAAAAGTVTLTGGVASNSADVGAAGTLDLAADFEISGTVANTNAGTIKVNANTLTFTGAGATLVGAGNVISATAATVGSGTLDFTKAATVTQAQLPNVNISGTAGKVTFAATAPSIYGNLALSSPVAGALTDGGLVVTLYGDFTRTDNTPANHALTGTLTFAHTTTGQTLTPGASLSLNNLILNKAAGIVVTLQASVIVKANLTITAGSLNVGDNNLNMTGAAGVFDNSGSAYSSTGNGYVVFEGTAGSVTGTGTFGNILVNLSIPGNAVVTASNISFSGILYINQGDFDVIGLGQTLTFNNTLVATPTIKINTTAVNSASLIATAGAIAVAAATTINLDYFGTTAHVAALEWSAGTALKLNDVTINTPAVAVTGFNGASTIAGTLTVVSTATLTQGANTYTLSGAAKTHSVLGTVGGGTLTVTGAGSAIIGGNAVGNTAKVNDIVVNLANATDAFTSTNLQEIADLTVTKGAAAVTMSNTVSKIVDVTLTAGSLNLNMPGATAASNIHTGFLTLTAGTLTYTRTASQNTVAGAITATAGDLILGSDVTAAVGVIQDDGDIDLGGNTLTLPGSATVIDYDRTAAGAAGTLTNGTLSLDAIVAQDCDINPGATFVLPNVEFIGIGGDVAILASCEIAGTVLFDNAATVTQTGVLTVSGGTIYVESDAGAFTGAMTITGTDVTLEKNYAIPTLVINSTGTVTVADGGTPAAARTITCATAFTLTKGILAMGKNHLTVSTAFTRTAGSITQTTGVLSLNVGVPSLGTGFVIDNLTLAGAANISAAKEKLTVNKNLVLSGALTTFADGDLTLGDGVLVHRTGNAFVLNKVPTFGANTDLKYSTYAAVANIAIAKEAPASIRNLTVLSDAGALKVTLAANKTITGTLSLADMLDVTSAAPDAVITMADGSTLELLVLGTLALDANLVKAGAMDLIYGAAVATSTRELGTPTATAYPTFTGNVTVKGNLTLDRDITIDGKLLLDGGNVVMFAGAAGDMVTLLGDFEQDAAEWFITNPGTVVLGGPNDADFILGGNQAVTANSKITLNKTNANSVVTLSGGNLTFPAAQPLTLTKGVLETDATSKVILTQSFLVTQPTQGFTRTSGVIAGNVEKFINNAVTVDISQVVFPTGDATGNYRPAVFYFKTSPQSSINLLVNHNAVSPGGETGLPMTLASQTITNYPDFYWTVSTDITLAPSYQFDVEFQAQGYTDYLLDGIGNIRLIRRGDGNVANPWVLQGIEANYDNSTIAADWPLVKVINATGGITQQGALFTYSQANKPPVVNKTATVNSVATPIVADAITIAEDVDTLVVTYVITDPDIGDAVTTTAVVPVGATWDGTDKTVTWTPDFTQEGDHLVIITATDSYAQETKDTLTVTVTNTNRAPEWTAVPEDTVKIGEGDEYTFTLAATDADGDTLAYSNVPNVPAPDSVSVIDTTGLLTIIPAFGEEGNVYDITVRVDDGAGGVVDSTFVMEVLKTNTAPVLTRVSVEDTLEIDEGALGEFIYSATDADGNALTYTTEDLGGDTTLTAVMVDSVFTWTPTYTDAGTYSFLVTVTDDGAPNKSDTDTLVVVVAPKNAPPVFTSVLPDTTVFLGDELTWTYTATDEDLDVLAFAFDGNSPATATLDAATGAFAWTPQTAQAFPVLIKVLVTDATDTARTQAEVVIEVITVTVSGVVTYNVSAEPIANAEVTLTGAETLKDTTDAAGAYSFPAVSAGAFTLTVTKTDQWGGSSSNDAYEVALFATYPDSTFLATALQLVAGDVVAPTTPAVPDIGDALRILQKSVDPNDNDYLGYDIADWKFDGPHAITVSTSNLTQDVVGIAAGDAKSDYNPNVVLPKTSLAVNTSDVLKIKKAEEFEMPISVSQASDIGSFTLKLKYPEDKLQFVGLRSNGGTLLSNVVDGVIHISWADFTARNSMKLNKGDGMAYVSFKATELFGKSEEVSLEVLDGSEISDRFAKSIDGGISVPAITVGIPDKFALSQNYPNPFNPSTTIQYDLPENGQVTLTIYNTLGQSVATLVNQKQEAGSYEFKFNASALASGVYLYRLHVQGVNDFTLTKKMLLMK